TPAFITSSSIHRADAGSSASNTRRPGELERRVRSPVGRRGPEVDGRKRLAEAEEANAAIGKAVDRPALAGVFPAGVGVAALFELSNVVARVFQEVHPEMFGGGLLL